MTDFKQQSSSGWDWETGRRIIADTAAWKKTHGYLEEPVIRADGEAAAAVVRVEEGEFSVQTTTGLWDGRWDKVWKLSFGPDGRLSALVSELGAWTMATEDTPWEESHDFVWSPLVSSDGSQIAIAAQDARDYRAILNGSAWEKAFSSLYELTMSPDGKRLAAAVQTVPLQEGEIQKFQSGCFTAAVDGIPWSQNFVNLWDLTFSPDGNKLAAAVRTSLYDYTVAVDGKTWDATFSGIWEPLFLADGSVWAPVRKNGKWHLVANGNPAWKKSFTQLWHLTPHPSGNSLAAICAPEFGQWTLAIDDNVWKTRFSDMVMDPVFSPDGRHLACIGKSERGWQVACDDIIWEKTFAMLGKPVFSPDGSHLAVRTEAAGNHVLFVDGKPVTEPVACLWDPIFNEDGTKLLIRGMGKEGPYAHKIFREVISIG